ncbi:hypothetical protein [Lactococcus garvieae]|uniref:hypothetical protein n=1 Tax=Lactococcus garvieae TaxID=1363 RepID=UPI0022E26691|nr:hypothetical protein [Lactococcus garvieae]
MKSITKHIFLIIYSLIMSLITGITIYLLEERIWLRVLIIWFLVVVLYKFIKWNLKNDDKNDKKKEWFYLFLDVVMATNAPFLFFVKDTPLLIVWLSLYGLILWSWAHETTNKSTEMYTEQEMIELKELRKLKNKRDKKLEK